MTKHTLPIGYWYCSSPGAERRSTHGRASIYVCTKLPAVAGKLNAPLTAGHRHFRETKKRWRRLANLDSRHTVQDNAMRCMPRKSSDRTKKLSRKEVRDLDVKIGFLEGVLNRDPKFTEALQLLGDHYTQRGRFEDSLKVDQKLSVLEPRDPLVFYNLACSYSLNSEFKLAVTALEHALTLGYRDFKWLSRDPDLRQLRKHPAYRSIRDKIRKMKVKISG